MGLKECQIILDNQWNTYYAGQTVNGRVEYVFDSPKKVRGMVLFYYLLNYVLDACVSHEDQIYSCIFYR